MAMKGRVVLVGKTGDGKSTVANMLVKGSLDPPHIAEIGDGARGTTAACSTFQGRGWIVVDTVGFGECDTGRVPSKEATAMVIEFLKEIKGEYSHIIFVKQKGRNDEVTEVIWKTFLQIFKGGESNFVVLFTHAKEKWLKENEEAMKADFKECSNFLCVDFPPVEETPEYENIRRRQREKERDRLEGQLVKLFDSCARPDIEGMDDEQIEQKAKSILQYIAKLVREMLDKCGSTVLTTVNIFVNVASIVAQFA